MSVVIGYQEVANGHNWRNGDIGVGEVPKTPVVIGYQELANGHNWRNGDIGVSEVPKTPVVIGYQEAANGHNWRNGNIGVSQVPKTPVVICSLEEKAVITRNMKLTEVSFSVKQKLHMNLEGQL